MSRPRARDAGIPLDGTPGPTDLVTDVPGLEVGQLTLVEGAGALEVGHGPVRTGVTVIHPRGRGGADLPCAAGLSSLNGNGEMTGAHWIAETGTVATPIALTNSHAVGPVHRAITEWCTRLPALARHWVLPVVGETFDGYLNDVNGRHVTVDAVLGLLDATTATVELGSRGGGTGMTCYGFKAGTGSASRLVPFGEAVHTVGVLVQANFGARHELTVAGVPVGRDLLDDDPMGDEASWLVPPGGGSFLAVVATDAPLLPHQLSALARRAGLGMARTGTTGSHFSGDLLLAVSTANAGAMTSRVPGGEQPRLETIEAVPWGMLDPYLTAAVQATEEAILDALFCAGEVVGRDGHRAPALPVDRVVELVRGAAGRGRAATP